MAGDSTRLAVALLAPSGGSSVSVPLTIDSVGATSITVRRGTPASGTLQTWDLEYREVGAETWAEWATGLTAETETVTGLIPSTEEEKQRYEFRATAHILLDATAQASAETDEEPPQTGPPLTLWSQIEGGQDFGNVITAGGISGWNTAVPAVAQTDVRNFDAEPVVAAQTMLENRISATAARMLGWGVLVGSTWALDENTYSVANGTDVGGIAITMMPELALPSPVAQNGQAWFQVKYENGGYISPAKSLGSGRWPTSNLSSTSRLASNGTLGVYLASGSSYNPFTSRLFLKRESNPYYVFQVFGDSTTASVRPTAASNNTAKEGFSFRANGVLRAAGKRVRIHSCGQGAGTWANTLARVRANLPWMAAGKVTRVLVQVWTWNSAWSSVEQADTAWAEYLVLEAEVKAAGIECSPFILHPYTTRTGVGQPEAFAAIKARVLAHPRGLALDEIMAGADWPNLPASESEDNVHQNGPGAIRTADAVASAALALAATDYPELA